MVGWVAVELLGMRREERSEPNKLSILRLRQERDENIPESVLMYSSVHSFIYEILSGAGGGQRAAL